MANDTLLSEQIYLSRDSYRELISEEVKRYLELENVDLTKSSFLSFLIDTISTLTGNILFYQKRHINEPDNEQVKEKLDELLIELKLVDVK